MKKMMSFYALTKNLGSSIGSTVMGYFYAMSVGIMDGILQYIICSFISRYSSDYYVVNTL